jgi:DnaJ-class molecular chaperone
LSDPKKKQMYDSGQMEYDGDQGMGGMGGMNIDPN